MKELKNILENTIKSMLPEFKPDEKCTHVFNLGNIVKLPIVTSPREMTCPMCGNDKGFRIPDGNSIVWSCANQQCIHANAKRENNPIYFSPPKPTLKLCGVPEEFENIKFSNIEQPENILKTIDQFCEKFQGFFLMAGKSGVGKTFASCAIMQKYLQKGFSALFLNISDLYLSWLDIKQSNRGDLDLMDRCTSCEFLVLDDLGTRTPSEGFLDFIYLIINKRANKKSCATVISTNMNSKDMSEKMGSAIFSRVAGGIVVKFEGQDRRIQQF